ncbi:MAG: DUF5050 domain-containing protein [Clostridiales bacterium]|nr:DUF5050 domain-containing protein [Clostridiales bacterium]
MMLRKIYLVFGFLILAVIWGFLSFQSNESAALPENVNILGAFADGEDVYFTVSNSLREQSVGLYRYDGSMFYNVVGHGKTSCYTADGEYIYYVDRSNVVSQIIRTEKGIYDNKTVLYTENGHIDFLYAGDKIIYSTSSGFKSGYTYVITEYSIYCMDTDGNNCRKLLELSTYVSSKNLTGFMVGGGYVYYTYPGVGDLYRINIESGVNEFVTSETQLSYNEDTLGVYMYNDKIYYSLSAYDEKGEFLKTCNLYRTDINTGARELVAEDVSCFKLTCGMLIYGGKIYDENGDVIGENINLSAVYGRDSSCVYFGSPDSSAEKEKLYKYNIKTGRGKNITMALNDVLNNGEDMNNEQKTAFQSEPLDENQAAELLEEYKGEWEIIDSPETNIYASVSKTYDYDDIHHKISISRDNVAIDDENIAITGVESEYYDYYKMYCSLNTRMEEFGFEDNLCKMITIEGYTGSERIIFCFLTDGEKFYYDYALNYLKMEKLPDFENKG